MRLELSKAAATFALAAAACAPSAHLGGDHPAEVTRISDIPPERTIELDLLFVIDNSANMAVRQESLAMSLDRLLSHLEFVPGQLASVHVGVTSTDLGVGRFAGEVPCGVDGDSGRLLVPAGLTDDDARFLRHLPRAGGGFDANYAPEDPGAPEYLQLVSAVSDMLRLGEDGCEYEQPLEAMRRVFTASPEGAAFRRQDAALAVVFLTDKDDCSALTDALFDPHNEHFSHNSPSFRCFEEGVVCDGDDVYLPGQREGCAPNRRSSYVADVRPYVDFLQDIQTDPSRLVVAGVMGDAGLVHVELEMDGSPQLAPACAGATGAGVYPPVRLQAFVDGFPGAGELASLCDPVEPLGELHRIGRELRKAIGTSCLDGKLRDMVPSRPGLQPQCEVRLDGAPIARCPLDPDPVVGDEPCFALDHDAEVCGDFHSQLALRILLPGMSEIPQATPEHALGLPVGHAATVDCVIDRDW